MKSRLLTLLMAAVVSPAWGAEPTASPGADAPGTAPASTGEAAPQSQDDRDKADAAAMLQARQKAVDDIRAGKPAPYYSGSPPPASPSSNDPGRRGKD